MKQANTKHPGRPFLDGSPAGKGTRTVTKCVSIPQEMAEYLKALGGGNLSKGVRMVVGQHIIDMEDVEMTPTPTTLLAQAEPYKPDQPLREAAYDRGFADGTDGVICKNPYVGELERRAYASGRRDGEAYYRKHAYSDEQ